MAEHQHAEREKQRDIDTLSFEEALLELEKIVRRLEQGSARLEEAIAAYQRGEALRRHCEKLLAHAQGKIEKITREADDEKSDKTKGKPLLSRQKLSSV